MSGYRPFHEIQNDLTEQQKVMMENMVPVTVKRMLNDRTKILAYAYNNFQDKIKASELFSV